LTLSHPTKQTKILESVPGSFRRESCRQLKDDKKNIRTIRNRILCEKQRRTRSFSHFTRGCHGNLGMAHQLVDCYLAVTGRAKRSFFQNFLKEIEKSVTVTQSKHTVRP
jgi:hypothetical protein